MSDFSGQQEKRDSRLPSRLVTAAMGAVAFVLAVRIVLSMISQAGPPPAQTSEYPPEFLHDWQLIASAGVRVGERGAPIQIVEFVDLECEACRSQHRELQAVRDRRGSMISIIFVPLPLSIHAHAEAAALHAECAGRQGRYDQFVAAAFESPTLIKERDWDALATRAGVSDADMLAACAAGDDARAIVANGRKVAKSVGVTGTPTILINGWLYRGVISQSRLEAAIDSISDGYPPPGALRLLGAVASGDGVRSVRHDGASLRNASRFAIEPVPTMVAGTMDAPPEFDLTAVESALVLSDGRIVVYAPLNPPRLLLFDASGAPVSQLFRRGRGPLEVVFGTRVSRGRGDTILLVDPINQRLSWISADNGVVRQRSLTTEQARRFGSVAGELNDGFVVLHRALGLLDDAGDTRLDEGTRRRIWAAVQVAGPGDLVTYRDSVKGNETVLRSTPTIDGERVLTDNVRLSSRAIVVTWDSLVVTGNTGEYRLTLANQRGETVGELSVARTPRAVTRDMRLAHRRQELAMLREIVTEARSPGVPSLDKQLEGAVYADSLPVIEDVHVSPNRLLWIVDAIAPTDTTWSATAFRLDGAVAGALSAPLHLGRPIAFGIDRVLLRREGEDGLVSLATHRFRASVGSTTRDR